MNVILPKYFTLCAIYKKLLQPQKKAKRLTRGRDLWFKTTDLHNLPSLNSQERCIT